MIRCRLRITTLLLLLATIICSFSVGSVEAQQNQETDLQHGATTTSFAPNGPASNTGTGFVDETNASTHAATGPGLKGTNSSHEAAGSDHEAAGSGHEASGSGHEAKPAYEAPTFMMFLGPAVAGVLAIVLIGCVIAFKNRKGK